MTSVEDVLGWLSSLEAVERAVLLEGDVRDAIFNEEASVGTQSGMPMDNEALSDARALPYNVAIMIGDRGRFPFDQGFTSIMMKDAQNNVCGFQVFSEEEKARIDAEGRHVWLSDDFAVAADADLSEVRFVLPSVPFTAMEKETDVSKALILISSPSTVLLALDLLAPELPKKTSVFIVSFRL